ncbi:hypothetical protein G9A89_023771 [Geosiphon pyriformis]|nr:hypothetical protein G9A89_023771 [Geosiphon pyriformis]
MPTKIATRTQKATEIAEHINTIKEMVKGVDTPFVKQSQYWAFATEVYDFFIVLRRQRGNKFKSDQGTDFSTQNLTTLAPELFINICKFLPPRDLLSLAKVCRLFNNYLTSDSSTCTQLIWRESRLKYLPNFDVTPPGLMSERNYIRLILKKGCQFCDEGRARMAWINWYYLVKACSDCYEKNLCGQDVLERHYQIPPEFCKALPCRVNSTSHSLYWLPHAKKLWKQYLTLPEDTKEIFLKEQKQYAIEILTTQDSRRMNEINDRHSQAEESRQKLIKRRQDIRERVAVMISEVKEDGTQKWNKQWILNGTIYNKALKSYSTHPFTERAWGMLRRKIIKEYEGFSQNKNPLTGPEDRVENENFFILVD